MNGDLTPRLAPGQRLLTEGELEGVLPRLTEPEQAQLREAVRRGIVIVEGPSLSDYALQEHPKFPAHCDLIPYTKESRMHRSRIFDAQTALMIAGALGMSTPERGPVIAREPEEPMPGVPTVAEKMEEIRRGSLDISAKPYQEARDAKFAAKFARKQAELKRQEELKEQRRARLA